MPKGMNTDRGEMTRENLTFLVPYGKLLAAIVTGLQVLFFLTLLLLLEILLLESLNP
jgi:hypothetical protein